MRSLFLVFAMACAPDAADFAVEMAPPPTFDLAVDPVIPGATLTLTASGLSNGETAFFFRGADTGPGICGPSGTPCLDITDAVMLGSARAGGGGRATLTGVVPSSIPLDVDHWFQAVTVAGGVTQVVRRSQTDGCSNPAQLAGANLSHRNLSGLNLGCADLAGADLQGADLSDADLFDATITGAWLDGANLDQAHMAWADLSDTSMTGVQITGTDLQAARLDRVDLRFARGTSPTLAWATATDLLLSDTQDLRGFNAVSADLQGLDISRSNAEGWSFSSADLDGVVFEDVDLEDASFGGASMVGTTFRGCNLLDAGFTSSTMTNTRFEQSDLRLVDMRFSDLTSLTFEGVLGIDMNLSSVDWFGATVFRDTDLRSTSIGTNGSGTRQYVNTVCPNGTLSTQFGNNCP